MSEQRPLKVVLYGAFGAPNTGDELILASILDHYLREDPFARFTVMAYHIPISSAFVEAHGAVTWTSELNWHFANAVGHDRTLVIPAIQELIDTGLVKKFPVPGPSIFRSLREADVFHVGGGGYFSQDFPNAVAHVLYCSRLLAEVNPMCRIVFSGHTIGPFGGLDDLTRERLAEVLRAAALVDIRDPSGSDWLEKQGIPYQLTCDDAFLADWILRDHKAPQSDNALFHMGGSNRAQPHRHERARDALVHAAKMATAAGLKVVPISFCPIDHDEQAIAEVMAAAHLAAEVVDCTALGVGGLLELFSGARFAIGTRLHVAITAMICHIPVFTVDPAPKVVALYERFGNGDFDRGTELAVPLQKFIDLRSRTRRPAQKRSQLVVNARRTKIDSLRRVSESLDGYPWQIADPIST